jgi:hypothetical protein
MQLHKPNLQEFLAAIKSSSTCSRNALRICSGNFLVLEISSSVIKNNQLLGSQARGKDSWIATYSCTKSDTGFRCCVFTSMSNNFCTLCGDFWADSHSGSSTMPAALLRVDHRTLVAVRRSDSFSRVGPNFPAVSMVLWSFIIFRDFLGFPDFKISSPHAQGPRIPNWIVPLFRELPQWTWSEWSPSVIRPHSPT